MKKIIYYFIKFIFKICFRLELKNPQGVEIKSERILIIANHESYIDGIILGLFLPVIPIFVINAQIAKNWKVRYFLKLIEHITIEPTHPMSVKKILREIESGRPVMIFPEGRITQTGALMKIYEGPAFIAAKSQATIYPVRIQGAVQSYYSKVHDHIPQYPRRLFPKITLTLVPSTKLPQHPNIPNKIARARASNDMLKVMQELIFNTRNPNTLFGAFMEVVKINPKSRKVLEDARQIAYSYFEIIKMTLMLGKITNKITSLKSNVGILLPNLAVTLGLIFALTNNRKTPAMLNFTAGIDGLLSACILANINVVFTSKAFAEQAKLTEKIDALQTQGIKVYFIEELKTHLTLSDKLWWLFYARFNFNKLVAKINNKENALILFTSGSEGKPKGVILSHRAILANVEQVRAIIDIGYKDKILNALPMFHSFGLTAGTLMPLLTGAKLYLHPSPLHFRLIPEIAYDKSCSVLFGTNTFLGHYGRFAHAFDFNHLRYVVAGAEKLNETVRNLWFEKFGIRIFEGYGTTEASPVIAVNTPMAFKSGTVGQFLPGIKYKLIPVEGIANGGVLHINAANLKTGYYLFDKPNELVPTSSTLGDGWYETGDIVEVDEEGFVKIVGRLKRFAKIAGEMISLEMAEAIAFSASNTHQHAVICRQDAARGEALILFTNDNLLTREHLQTSAKKLGSSELAIPKIINYLAEIPMLGTGKTDYIKLANLISEKG